MYHCRVLRQTPLARVQAVHADERLRCLAGLLGQLDRRISTGTSPWQARSSLIWSHIACPVSG
jgi:hypothetical protein